MPKIEDTTRKGEKELIFFIQHKNIEIICLWLMFVYISFLLANLCE